MQCVCGFEQVDFLCEVRIGERERDLRRGRLPSHELVRFPQVTERAGQAGAQLGHPELEQDIRPLLRIGRLGQGAFEIRPGDVGRALVARLLRGFAQGCDDRAACPRLDIQQVRGNPLSGRTAVAEQFRRSLVAAFALGVAQVGVHGRAENRVRKRKRASSAKDVRTDQLGRGRNGCIRIQSGEGSDKLRVGLLTQDRYGPGEGLGLGAEATNTLKDEAGKRLGSELADAFGCARSRFDLLLEHGVHQLVEQERIAGARRVHRLHELLGGIGSEPLTEELRDGVEAERSRANDRRERLRLERVEYGRVGAGLSRPGADRHCHRQPFESAGEIGEEAQRRRVAPVDVVHGEQHGPLFGEVGGQPEETVERGLRGVLPGSEPTAGLAELEERRGETRRAGEEPCPLVIVGRGEACFEELADDAVREVSFELTPPGAQHLETEAVRCFACRPEQARLPDSRRSLEQHERSSAALGLDEQQCDEFELLRPFQQGGGPCSCHRRILTVVQSDDKRTPGKDQGVLSGCPLSRITPRSGKVSCVTVEPKGALLWTLPQPFRPPSRSGGST